MKAKRIVMRRRGHLGLFTDQYDNGSLPNGALTTATNVSWDAGGNVIRAGGTRRTTAAALTQYGSGDPRTGLEFEGYADPVSGRVWVVWPFIGSSSGGGSLVYTALPDGTYPYSWTGVDMTPLAVVLGTAGKPVPFATLGSDVFALFPNVTAGPLVQFSPSTGAVVTMGSSIGATTNDTLALEAFNGRLWAIKDNTLYWSGIDDGISLADVTAGGGAAIAPGGGILTQLMASSELLYLFYEGSIGALTGWSQDDVSIATGLRGVAWGIGLANRRALCRAFGDMIFFAGSDGYFYRLLGGELTNISRGRLARGASTSGWSRCAYDPATSDVWWINPVFDDDVTPADTNGATAGLCYNIRSNAWSTRTFDGTTTSPAAIWSQIAGSQARMYATCPDWFVRVVTGTKQDVLSDGTGGTEVSSVIRFASMDNGDGWSDKGYRWVRLGWTGTPSAAPTVTFNATTAVANPTAPVQDQARYQVGTRQRTADVTVTDAATPDTLGLSEVEVEGVQYDRR